MRTWIQDTRGRVTLLALVLLGTAFLALLVVGSLVSVPTRGVPPVYAACKTAWPACAGSDTTRTSTLWVDHRTGEEYLIPVEPETGNEDTAVSPTSQTWSQIDTTFPCSLDCNYDATLVILYE